MACHHGVEGSCMVCERVAFKKANPAPVQVVLLHLHRVGTDTSLCGLPETDCLFSSLSAHDEERFCRQCLRAQRTIESRETARLRKAWRALPWAERMRRTYGGVFRPTNIYDAMGALMLAVVAVLILVGAGVVWVAYRVGGGWYATLTAVIMLLFLLIGPPTPRGRL